MAFAAGVITFGSMLFTSSCGSDHDGQKAGPTNTNTNVGPTACLTPQEGCSCELPGTKVPCGKSISGANNFIYCYEGERTCLETGKWGDCTNGSLAAKSINPLTVTAGGIGTLALGTPGACTSAGGGGSGLPACASTAPGTGLSCDCTAASGTCGTTCNSASSCAAVARTGKTAQFFANSVTGTASFRCESGSNCAVDCNSVSGSCDLDCAAGAACNLACNSVVGGCNLRCAAGASCIVSTCTSSGTCCNGPGCAINAGAAPPAGDGGAGDAGASLDPCDPYCNFRADDPIGLPLDGGFGLTEGGLSVLGGDAGVVLPTTPQFNATGDSNCGGAVNVHATGSCSATPFSSCQQDFRCDTVSDTCVWNGGEGYYDNTISPAAIDLQIGAGCEYSGNDIIPVCNRGNLAVPANTVIGINITNAVEDGCTAVHPTFDCGINVGPSGLAPGRCTSIGGCPVNGNKNAVVNATAGTPNVGRDMMEAPGRCANNASAVKFTGAPGCATCAACDTVVTGKVYDPSTGLPALTEVNTLPLAGISVFQPSGALTTFTDGVQCDTCTSLDSPKITSAVTDATGSFSMSGVTPGPNTRIVVQSGRWRRETLVNVPACTTTNFPTAGTFRLPRSKTDFPTGGSADIPKIAIVTGPLESLSCLVRRLGIDATEMKGRSASTDTNRIQIWNDKGMTTTSPVAKVVDGTAGGFFTQAVLDEYAAILFDCEGDAANSYAETSSAAEKLLLQTYANKGGRVFADHWAVWWLLRQNSSSSFPATSTWDGAGISSTSFPNDAYVQIGTPPQQLFSDWLDQAAGATSPAGTRWMTVPEGRRTAITPTAGQTTEWIRGNSTTWNRPTVPPSPSPGSHNLSYSFETPIGSTCTGGGTGRVIANSMHVSQTRGTTGTFPTSCASNLPLGPEEKALTYQFFQLTACALGGAPPPVTPTPTPAALLPLSLTYSVDFTSSCRFDERTVWQLFQYKAFTPPGTSIEFRASTSIGGDAASLPSAPGTLPTSVPIGTAFNAAAFTDVNGWTFDTNSACSTPPCPAPVSYHLANDPTPPQISGDILRVFMTFRTNGVVSPILYNWRQLFSCVPAE